MKNKNFVKNTNNSQEIIKVTNKKSPSEKLTIEINRRETDKKKILLDNKIRIKQK